jgi:transposase
MCRSQKNLQADTRKGLHRGGGLMKKVHVGIDLHKRYMQVAALDEKTGQVTDARIENRQASLTRWMARFKNRSIKAVVESFYGWYWLVEALEQMGHEVVLSNPLHRSLDWCVE